MDKSVRILSCLTPKGPSLCWLEPANDTKVERKTDQYDG